MFHFVSNNILAVAPVVTLMNQAVVSNDTTTINCSATAKPRAEIQWMRNGMVLSENSTRITINLIELGDCIFTRPPGECVYTSTLEISSTVLSDAGEYVCNATNPVGSVLETALLIVNGMKMSCLWVYNCAVEFV